MTALAPIPPRAGSAPVTARGSLVRPAPPGREPGRGHFVVSAFTAVVGVSLLAGLLVAPAPTRLLLGIAAGAVYVSALTALLGAVRRRHGRVAALPVTGLGIAALAELAVGLGLAFLPLLLSVEGETALSVLTALIYAGVGLLVLAGLSVVVAVVLRGERSAVVTALALAVMLLVPFFHLGRAVLP